MLPTQPSRTLRRRCDRVHTLATQVVSRSPCQGSTATVYRVGLGLGPRNPSSLERCDPWRRPASAMSRARGKSYLCALQAALHRIASGAAGATRRRWVGSGGTAEGVVAEDDGGLPNVAAAAVCTLISLSVVKRHILSLDCVSRICHMTAIALMQRRVAVHTTSTTRSLTSIH